jgi:hypothetical protein
MELIITNTKSQSLSKRRIIEKESQPEGILNSNYKQIVNQNLKSASPNTVFGIKQRVKSLQFQTTSTAAETLLKLSVFTVAILIIFA